MWFFRAFAVIVLAVLAVGLAGAIFQTGYLAGVAADGGAPVIVGPGYPYGWPVGGWVGGIVGFFGFLVVFLIFIGLLRAIFGGGHGRGRDHGWERGRWGEHHGEGRFASWEERARQAHDEWHRREATGAGGVGAEAPTGSVTPPSGSGPA
ncbi:MAG TPA: hypothetical protein VFX65_01890 [Candidatus Limnocylindrales bacterium]|nr:hypothetical protein [Candidatus Limnocylindrales bacterium]